MDKKKFNVTVVYTDGTSKSSLHTLASSREEIILKEIEEAKAWNYEILSVTILDYERENH